MSTEKTSDLPSEMGDAVRSGMALTGGMQAARQVIEFGTSIALARLLLPADFGVVAVVGGFLQLSYIVSNLGMGIAVIQAGTLSEHDRDAAYTFSTGLGALFTVAMALLAPVAATFFAMPMLRLVMPIMALQVLLAGMVAIPIALLRRELRYGALSLLDGVGAVIYATVSVGLALGGFGLWSLVWPALVAGTWSLAASHWLSGYRPRLRLPATASVNGLVGYGSSLALKNVLVNAGRNGDNFVVARLLGQTATGLYSRAFNFSVLPQTRFVALVYGICFPAFCRLREEMDRFRDWYAKATTAVAVVVSPILFGLAVLSDEITAALYGERWMAMTGSLRILALAALLNALHMLGGAAIEASGKLRYEVATETMYAVLVVCGAIVGAQHGIAGVAAAVLLASAAMYVAKAFTLRAAVGLPIRRYFGASLPSVLAAAAMAEVVYVALDRVLPGTPTWHPGPWTRIGVGMSIGAPVYVAALFLLAPEHLKLVGRQVVQLVAQRWRRIAVAS